MLTETEVKDLEHTRKQDPEWAKVKAGHYLADAAACDERLRESLEFVALWAKKGNVDWTVQMSKTARSFEDMGARYRERARILMGESNG